MTRGSIDRESVERAASRPTIRCRQITDADVDDVIVLLTRGFPERTPRYWRQGLRRMHDRLSPDSYPRYGYVMVDGDRPVGVILLIFAAVEEGIRCNVSSWYVEPAYRGFSNILLSIPLRFKSVTFFNISPAPNTIETITAQGFSRYGGGAFHAVCAFEPHARGVTVRQIKTRAPTAFPLLARHASYGCLCYEVRFLGEAYPFVFLRSRLSRGRIPCAQLVYCRDVAEFVRFSGALGRRLLQHGLASITIDADGPITGLRGRYTMDRRVKYFRGDIRPALSDLRDSELVVFGP